MALMIRRYNLAFLSLAIILLIFPAHASAAKQYRCNGKIQYRPCGQPINYGKRKFPTLQSAERNLMHASYGPKKKAQGKADDLYAEVVTSNFRNRANSDGQWRGRIKGNGDIHMTLQLLQANKVESRYMGHVALVDSETSFNFISVRPKGKDWTWKIIALAK